MRGASDDEFLPMPPIRKNEHACDPISHFSGIRFLIIQHPPFYRNGGAGSLPSHPTFVKIDPYTMRVHLNSTSSSTPETHSTSTIGSTSGDETDSNPHLYAAGAVRGDNFVRFLIGDAWAIAADVLRKRKNTPK
jgi:hypothetical protein